MAKKDDLYGMGRRIAALRRERKLTQEALADKLNVSTKHISHVERGCASLSLRNLTELCQIFDCSLDYLVMGEYRESVLQKIPAPILSTLRSGDEESVSLLMRYLQVYADLRGSES